MDAAPSHRPAADCPASDRAVERRGFLGTILAVLALAATSLLVAPAGAAPVPGPTAAPVPMTAAAPPTSARQVIAVSSPSAGSSQATLTAWDRDANGIWRKKFGPVAARVGSAGIGAAAREGSRLTPQGTHRLDQAFGRLANPGTRLRYFATDTNDWWDGNVNSPTYNTHVRRATSPGGASENLYRTGAAYDYAVNMAYNAARVPGGGSAFFLHIGTGSATAGCVSIDRTTLRSILQWLDPAKNPVIDIRIGRAWTPPAKMSSTLTQTTPTQFVAAGRAVTLRGTLTSSSGQKLSGMSPQVWARAHGGKNWAKVGVTRTDAKGAYAFAFRPTGRKDYQVRWVGATQWHGSTSRVIYLPVK